MSELAYNNLKSLNEMHARVSQVVSPVSLVGGCVRDALLGKEPHDFDFTTPLLPDEIEAQVRAYGRKPYLAGKRFGTVGFKLDGEVVEVTTYRSETYPTPGRHPKVAFESDLTTDLSRRDFTINALAYDGTLHDPFNGCKDLEAGIIRAVGNPQERFEEDPLRILRAARFSAQYGFVCEASILTAADKVRSRLFDVAKQRWSVELTKMLCAPFPVEGLNVLVQSGVLYLLFPELNAYTSPAMVLKLARALGKVHPEHTERWAVLFVHIAEAAKPANREEQVRVAQEAVKRYAPYLRWSRAEEFEVLAFLEQPWSFYIPGV